MSGIRIHEIRITQQTAQKEQFLSPWSTSFANFENNEHVKQMLMERTSEGTNLSANALAPIANSILIPDAKTGRLANIGGSYQDDRFSMQIVVETVDSQMVSRYEVITAYTDHLGFQDTLGKMLFDDNMLVFVNGIADLTRENAGEGGDYWQVQHIDQIITPVVTAIAGETQVDTNMVSCRPTDTLAVMASQAMSGAGSRTTTTSMLLNSQNRRSSRDNNVASHYLSKTISSFRDQMIDPSSQSQDAILQAAANDLVADRALSQSVFLRELRVHTSFGQERACTWGELRKLDPTLKPDDPRIKPILLRQSAIDTSLAMVHESENWNSAYNETIIARQAVSCVPAWMAKALLGSISIEAHNATLDGSVTVNVHNVQGIRQDVDVRNNLKLLKNSFVANVFSQLLQGDLGKTLYIHVMMDAVGMGNVIVSVNGGAKKPYNTALFNDSSWSSCLAGGMLQLQNLSHELDIICTSTTNRALSSMVNYEEVVSGTSGNRGVAGIALPNQPIAGGVGRVNIGVAKPAAESGLMPGGLSIQTNKLNF